MIAKEHLASETLKKFSFLLFFFAGLSIVYINDVSVYWGYMGFPRDFSLVKLILSLILLGPLSFLVSGKVTVRSFFLLFLTYAYIIPGLILFYMGGGFIYLFMMFSGFSAMWITQQIHISRVKSATFSRKSVLIICLGLAFLGILGLIAFGAYKNINFNIFRVYEFRRDAAANLPSIFGYIISPISKIVLPMGIVLGIYYKSWFTVVLFSIFTIVFFGLTHHKSTLVAPFFIALIYYLLQKVHNLRFLHLFFASIVIIGLIEYFVVHFFSPSQGAGVFSTLVIRRVLFIPPLLDQFYIDFFSAGDLIYWANSRVSLGFSTTEYDATAPFLIGEEFFGNSATSANTGFIGSGFSNAGFFGVVLYGIILGAIISMLESHGRALGYAFAISVSLNILKSTVTSTDLVTSLLTHGLLFLLLLLSIMPKPRTIVGKTI